MKRIIMTLAVAGLLLAGNSYAQARSEHPDGHGGPVVGPPNRHPIPQPDPGRRPDPRPIPDPGRHPGPGPGHNPGGWHGPEHGWQGGWDRHIWHGAWFWYGESVCLIWNGAMYDEVTVYWDPNTGEYYWIDVYGQWHYLD
jgi:hypothetical protein